jgi:hypothetical protein
LQRERKQKSGIGVEPLARPHVAPLMWANLLVGPFAVNEAPEPPTCQSCGSLLPPYALALPLLFSRGDVS